MSIYETCDRLERRDQELLSTPVREIIRQTLEECANLPLSALTRTIDELSTRIERKVAVERHRCEG